MGQANIRIAVLADIHGNLPALASVVEKLEEVEPDHVIVNGDLINAVPFSADVVDYIRSRPWTVVRGNHEFYFLDFGTERAPQDSGDPARWGGLHWLVEQITPAQAAYLAMLPDDRTICLPGTEPLRVSHGVPGRNRVGFYPGQSVESIAREVGCVEQSTLVSAHTHVQVDRHVYQASDGVYEYAMGNQPEALCEAHAGVRHWHIMNPGSVGLPLNGSPTAQFALLESVAERESAGGWKATHYKVAYDRRPALDAFITSGLLAAGGAIAQLFYWELVTAEPEIIHFYGWARQHDLDPDIDVVGVFEEYATRSGRRSYVRARDPLYAGASGAQS